MDNKNSNEDRIGKITVEKDALEDLADDNEKDGLTFQTQMDLSNEIKQLYKVAKTRIGVTEDPSVTQKINNSEPLNLVEDTENILNKFFEEFEFLESFFADEFNETSTRIKKAKRT